MAQSPSMQMERDDCGVKEVGLFVYNPRSVAVMPSINQAPTIGVQIRDQNELQS